MKQKASNYFGLDYLGDLLNATWLFFKPNGPEVKYYLRPPASNNGFPVLDKSLPEDFPIDQLEDVVRRAFAKRGMRVLDEFFTPSNGQEPNPYYPENLSAFGFAVNNASPKKLIATIIASDIEVKGKKIRYINKYAVDPPYQGNGVGKNLFEVIEESAKEDKMPIILRTSDPVLDAMYWKSSDISTKIGDYYIHGYGFIKVRRFKFGKKLFKKIIGEKFEGAKGLFDEAAGQVAKVSATVVPL